MASVYNEVLLSPTALTAASNTGTGVLLVDQSTAFIGQIVATSVNAATTIAAKIQHSPDNSTWYDLVSFTNIVGAAGDEIKQITISVLPYVRSSVTLSGVTKAATVQIKLWYDKW